MNILDSHNKYYKYMYDITSEDLYNNLILYGLFERRLPDIFDCTKFLNFCKNHSNAFINTADTKYVIYEMTRCNNTPRNIGIPTPMAYEKQCKVLSTYWNYLQEHFKNTTQNQEYKISKVHIRKSPKYNGLFYMNYENDDLDTEPQIDLCMGNSYIFHTDITEFYSSIYTHSIEWALIGKAEAKKYHDNKKPSDKDEWFESIDTTTRYTSNRETHGILIGPHTSNIISEIILCKIDSLLNKKWKYIRAVDDYTCFVENKEDAENFRIDLSRALRKYGLTLNKSKTFVEKIASSNSYTWKHKIQKRSSYLNEKEIITLGDAKEYINFAIYLANKENNYSRILYAIKALNADNLSYTAKEYICKKVTILALIYPYLVPVLCREVYDIFSIEDNKLDKYVNKLYEEYIKKDHYDISSHIVTYASRNNIKINSFNIDNIINQNDCILLLASLVYSRHFKLNNEITKLESHSKKLIENDKIEEYWPFVYECSSCKDLKHEWKSMKCKGVSFLKKSL